MDSEEELQQRAVRHIADLRSENKRVRERALDGLHAIGPDPVLGELLTANTVAVNGCKATWLLRRVAVSLTIGLAGILVYSCLSTCNYNNAWSWYSFLFGGLCTFVSGIFFLVVKPSSGSEFRRRSLIGVLCRSEDPRTVGALCDYLRSKIVRKRDVDSNQIVRNALVRLLPRVNGAVADELTSQQRGALRQALRSNHFNYYLATGRYVANDIGLTIALLQCIENTGDISAIPDVERFCGPITEQMDQRSVAEQANHCLQVLRDLQEADKQGKALLRSSESPTAAAELLREAKSPNAVPDELLRPGSDTDESN